MYVMQLSTVINVLKILVGDVLEKQGTPLLLAINLRYDETPMRVVVPDTVETTVLPHEFQHLRGSLEAAEISSSSD